MKVQISVYLRKTGTRRFNTYFSATVEINCESLDEPWGNYGSKYDCNGLKIETTRDWIRAQFKEDLSQYANEDLLDECRGWQYSTRKHGQFEDALENQDYRFKILDDSGCDLPKGVMRY